MINKKTDEEVLEYFIFKMKKYGWVETKGDGSTNGIITKTIRREHGTDDIYIDTEGDIYSWATSYAYIDLSSQELKLLAEYKSFIENIQVEILRQKERITQYQQERL